MRQFYLMTVVAALSVAASFVLPGEAKAQYSPQQGYIYRSPNDTLQRPTTSPYLNLLRNNGQSMGLNYYNQVRPQIMTQNNLEQQQAGQQRLDEETNRLQVQQQEDRKLLLNPFTGRGGDPLTGATRQIRTTGHPTAVLNTRGRFLTR